MQNCNLTEEGLLNPLETNLIDYANLVEKLNHIKNNHKMWRNPLLIAAENGVLSIEDMRFLFSQYFYYSKNFTKLLAASMIKTDNSFYRSKIVENLWEENGSSNINQNHSKLFTEFLEKTLGISTSELNIEGYAKYFFDRYLSACLNYSPSECMAALAFGTEGIVSRLYAIFKKSLIDLGIGDDELLFFNIHIECDDNHAITLQEMALSYINEANWLEISQEALINVMNIRDDFFTNIYKSIQNKKITQLSAVDNKQVTPLKINIAEVNNSLYQHEDLTKKINFKVNRIPFSTKVLDPRLVEIAPGFKNEYHQHAHETVILILDGLGEVNIEENFLIVTTGDLIYVPRWKKHQTKNTGDKTLKFFAVTDFGFTSAICGQKDSDYRELKHIGGN